MSIRVSTLSNKRLTIIAPIRNHASKTDAISDRPVTYLMVTLPNCIVLFTSVSVCQSSRWSVFLKFSQVFLVYLLCRLEFTAKLIFRLPEVGHVRTTRRLIKAGLRKERRLDFITPTGDKP